MKKTLLIIFAVFLSLVASAQKIHFTDTSNVWNEVISLYNDGLGAYSYYTYHFVGDTTISSIDYKLFNFDPNSYGNSLSIVREDTILKKVYIRDVINDSDMILLDYNLNVGDTFSTYNIALNHYYRYVVSGIDSTLINGVWHKVWHFPTTTTDGLKLSFDIIEGVGCIQHPTYLQHPGGVEPPVERIYCFSNAGVRPLLSPAISFFNNITSCIDYSHLYTNELKQNHKIQVYPNPVTTELIISAPDKITSIAITNLLGQTLYSQEYNTQQVQVSVADLPKGIYFVKVNGTEVRKFVKE